MYVCMYKFVFNEKFIFFVLLYVEKSLSFSPRVLVNGSPKLPAMIWISPHPFLAFRSPEGKM